jgi:cation diffusion facilitator family transporter
VIGIGLVAVTGWIILDPIVALLVAANIVWTGLQLLRETSSGLLDSAIPAEDQRAIALILSEYESQGVRFHALRTRVAGSRCFISFHVLVPGAWTVQRGHDLCEVVEHNIRSAFPNTDITTHLEPLEDPVSWDDEMQAI